MGKYKTFKTNPLVGLEVDVFQLTQSHEVGSDENPKLSARNTTQTIEGQGLNGVARRRDAHLRSCSRFSRSREWPWCCIRTHNLFISEKLRLMKSIVSCTVPVSEPVLKSKNTKQTELMQFDESTHS